MKMEPSRETICCSSPTEILSEKFNHNWTHYDTRCGTEMKIYHPCCGKVLAEEWESERENLKNNKISSCLGYGLLSRATHVVSWAFNTVTAVASPLICIAGSTVGAGTCCFSGVMYGTELCCKPCAPEALTHRVHQLADSSKNFAANTTANSCIISATLIGIGAFDTLKLPFNCIAPEVVNECCCQQETNLKLNSFVACKEYMA